MEKNNDTMEKIVSLCKRRGFVFQGSEIYGGLKGTWDLGPLGVALNNNIKREWWKMFVDGREDMYGLDAAILMNEKVWEASGHTGAGFSDVLVTCLKCGKKHRLDKLAEEFLGEEAQVFFDTFMTDWMSSFSKKQEELIKDKKIQVEEIDIRLAELQKERAELRIELLKNGIDPDTIPSELHKSKKINFEDVTDIEYHAEYKLIREILKGGPIVLFKFLIKNKKIKCSDCENSNFSEPVDFNLMFETKIGPEGTIKSYLRPETAQGIFVNFKNVVDSMSPKLPFGIAQVGKAFRNEIAPREFLFRVREFEQMEIEYFVEEKDWQQEFEKLRLDIKAWHAHLGLKDENIREYEVPENDLAHYSKRTIDFEYNYPGKGFDELAGFAYRTDHDLKSHEAASGVKMRYVPVEGAPFIPHVLEPSFGVGRAFTAVLAEAYTEDEMGGEVRTYLKLPTHLAPYRVAVSPLLKNKPELVSKAREVFALLKKEYGNVAWDDNSNVGKRYRRQDEIGTPYCVTIDFDTLGEENPSAEDTVTVRHRDSGEQERVAISELVSYLR